jgi:hypothetical protein
MSYNWNNGQLLTLNPGDTAVCQTLNAGQLYGLFFYNSAQNDTGANLAVVWSNSQPPVTVNVPGTTGNQGLASVVFVYGGDTTTVSVSMLQNQPGAQVQAFICSVKMPTDTSGINNWPLPEDGKTHSFSKFTRYYDVPASHWYQLQVQSNINQFIFVQFKEQSAQVVVLNSTSDPGQTVQGVGSAVNMYKVNAVPFQNYSYSLQGNGSQIVWINADSVQNSQTASISLQSLTALYDLHSGELVAHD